MTSRHSANGIVVGVSGGRAKPLLGRVTRTSDGAAIANATVAITRLPREPEYEDATVVLSDATGRWTASHVEPGEYAVGVSAIGFVPSIRDHLDVGDERQEVDFALDVGGVAVTGVVDGEDGAPIARARVTARRDDVQFITLTHADGSYALSLAEGDCQVAATHDDYLSDARTLALAGSAVTANFVLKRGRVIRGQVVARADNKPVSGALVQAFGTNTSAVATADADGNFSLRRLRLGTIWLFARGGGYASTKRTRVELDGPEVNDVQVVVDEAYIVAGRVVAKTTKQGIAGATISAMPLRDGGPQVTAVSDNDGTFEISGLRPESYALHASKPGLLFEMSANVEVVNADVTDVTIEVQAGATLEGRVDPPVVAQIGFALAADAPLDFDNESSVAMVRAQSDANGAFTLRGAPRGPYEIHAMAKDGRSGTLPIVIDGDRSGLVIRLSPRASVAGRVIDPKGQPIVGVDVFPRRSDLPLEKLIRRNGIFYGALTSADGSFKIVGLDAGRYRLSVVDSRRGSSSMQDVEVELEGGGVRTDVTITIDVPTGKIRGQVLGPDRTPALGARVQAVPSGEEIFMGQAARTDANGNFEILGVQPGRYGLVVDGPGGTSKAVMRGVNSGDVVTIVLAPLSSLTVHITPTSKEPRPVLLDARKLSAPSDRRQRIPHL